MKSERACKRVMTISVEVEETTAEEANKAVSSPQAFCEWVRKNVKVLVQCPERQQLLGQMVGIMTILTICGNGLHMAEKLFKGKLPTHDMLAEVAEALKGKA